MMRGATTGRAHGRGQAFLIAEPGALYLQARTTLERSTREAKRLAARTARRSPGQLALLFRTGEDA